MESWLHRGVIEMSNFLVFAGTSEGRQLVELLWRRGAEVCASVATDYGQKLLPMGVQVYQERLDAQEMETLLQTKRFDCVIDATHPYAKEVTTNIKAACLNAGMPCLRLLRPESQQENCLYAADMAQAAQMTASMAGKILLTTGSKELDVFARDPQLRERVFVRVLPVVESIQRCAELGFSPKQVIAMQGPFSCELNAAMLRQTGAKILVTKESGAAGGFAQKREAAQKAGATVIVIGRPSEQEGLSFEQLITVLEREFALAPQVQKPYFPLFVDLSGSRVILFGGGKIALRRAAALLPFCGELHVVAPQICSDLKELEISFAHRAYQMGDCAGYDLVLAATDDRAVNHAIYREAAGLGIAVNVADCPKECSFYFPALVQQGDLVIGISSSGKDHRLVKMTASRLRAGEF